jgi:hypothetical protein
VESGGGGGGGVPEVQMQAARSGWVPPSVGLVKVS